MTNTKTYRHCLECERKVLVDSLFSSFGKCDCCGSSRTRHTTDIQCKCPECERAFDLVVFESGTHRLPSHKIQDTDVQLCPGSMLKYFVGMEIVSKETKQ